jgi:transcriptional regulator with XRE-family HTH domain
MSVVLDQSETCRRALAATFRAVRTHRGLSQAEVAAAMGLSPRTYQQIEAGETKLNLEHLAPFARATGCDPLAVAAAVQLDQPQFALAFADNKLMTIVMLAAEQFLNRVGPAAKTLRANDLTEPFNETFEQLAALALRRGTNEAELAARLRSETPDERDT